MQAHFNLESFIVIAILLVGIAFLAPKVAEVANLQNTIELEKAKSQTEIAKQQARAAVAPTLAAIDVQLANTRLISETQALEMAKLKAQSEIDSQTRLSKAQTDALNTTAQGEAERNRFFGYGIAGLLLTAAVSSGGYALYHKRGKHQIEQQTLLLEQGKLDIQKAQIEVLSKAVDTLSRSGGRMMLQNGHILEFTPSNQIPIVLPIKKEVSLDNYLQDGHDQTVGD